MYIGFMINNITFSYGLVQLLYTNVFSLAVIVVYWLQKPSLSEIRSVNFILQAKMYNNLYGNK